MSGCIAGLARNPVAANLLTVLIAAGGLLAGTAVRVEVFPELELDSIGIRIPYLGAAPEEVESGVVTRIEEAVHGIDGVRRVVSTATGNASVMVDIDPGADARRLVDEIKNNIDAITTLPAATEEPVIRELTARNQVVNVAISGAAGVAVLKTLAERVRDGLTALPAITSTDMVNAPPYEIPPTLRNNLFVFAVP